MFKALKNVLLLLFVTHSLTTPWASGLPYKDHELSSQEDPLKRSTKTQSAEHEKISSEEPTTDLVLSPFPKQARPFLYKLIPPHASSFKKFSILGTLHTYPHFMMPSSVLKTLRNAQRIIVEIVSDDSSEDDSSEDDPQTLNEKFKEMGVFMDISTTVKPILQNQLDFWSDWYDKMSEEYPMTYQKGGKAPFLKGKEELREKEIFSFLSSWSRLLSDEERHYVLQRITEAFPSLMITDLDLGRFHPAVVSAFLHTHIVYNDLYGMDKFLEPYALDKGIRHYGLETQADRDRISFSAFMENDLPVSFFVLQGMIEGIKMHFQSYCQKSSIPRFQEQMKDSMFSDYHHGKNHSPTVDLSGELSTQAMDLRTQEWLTKLEKHLHSKGTVVAVGLAHVPDILEWAQAQGYTVKRSEN